MRQPRILDVTIPPPPKRPSFTNNLKQSTNAKLIGIGTLVVALANAPAFVELVRKPDPPPPAATKADVELLRVNLTGLQASLDSLRSYLQSKHAADEQRHLATQRALDRFAGPNEVATTKTDYPLPP